MSDVILVEQALEPGEIERAKSLFEGIGRTGDSEGVVAVLQKEGVYTESAFLQRRDDGHYVLYYIEAEDGQRVKDVFDGILADPEGETEGLTEFIREFEAVTAGDPQLADAELLYHLVNPERAEMAT